MVGAPRRWGRAFFALRQRPSQRWRSSRRTWSNCAPIDCALRSKGEGAWPAMDCGKASAKWKSRREFAKRVRLQMREAQKHACEHRADELTNDGDGRVAPV